MVEDSPDHLAAIYPTDDPQDALTFRTDQGIDLSAFSGTGSCFLDPSCPSIPGDIFISLRFEDARGDGINFAQLIMSFAELRQLLVSRSYYDIVSCLLQEYAQLFPYKRAKAGKHIREHDIYSMALKVLPFILSSM